MPVCQMSATPAVGGGFLLSHTMVAGGPFFGATGYNAISGPFGSLSPTTFKGLAVSAVQHSTSSVTFGVILPGNLVKDFWNIIKIQSADPIWDGRQFLAAQNDFFQQTGNTEWRFDTTADVFINGQTYLLDWQ